jgi:antitoxin CptB
MRKAYTTTFSARGRRCLMDQREEWNRAKWASRRGLLELDLLLSPFVAEAFSDLSDDLRADYRELLFQDDQDLLEWIMGRADITNVRFLDIVDSIRRFHRIPL